MQLLLDTCAMLWLAEDRAISAAAAAALDDAYQGEQTTWVSPISAWEIGMLVARRRIALSASPTVWFGGVLSRPGMALCPMEPEILIELVVPSGRPAARPG